MMERVRFVKKYRVDILFSGVSSKNEQGAIDKIMNQLGMCITDLPMSVSYVQEMREHKQISDAEAIQAAKDFSFACGNAGGDCNHCPGGKYSLQYCYYASCKPENWMSSASWQVAGGEKLRQYCKEHVDCRTCIFGHIDGMMCTLIGKWPYTWVDKGNVRKVNV